jgi:hypothetical protein
VLATDDVVDLVREAGVALVDAAVLTTLARAPSHLGSQFFADITRHERGFGGPAPLTFSEYVPIP